MKNRMDSALQGPLGRDQQLARYKHLARFAARGMVMLELQFAILILGVGVAANLSIQTQALQSMIATAQRQEAVLLQDEAILLGRQSPLDATLTVLAPAEMLSPPF